MAETTPISILVGRTLAEVTVQDMERVFFRDDGGNTFCAYHMQDCCETVSLTDVVGDTDSILGSPITLATETVYENETPPELELTKDHHESYTWTIHRVETSTGCVVFRWFGESSGYYSESVYFTRQ